MLFVSNTIITLCEPDRSVRYISNNCSSIRVFNVTPSCQTVFMNRTTLASLSIEITSEADAYAYLENMRWGDTPRCAHCQGTNVFFIESNNGVSRRTAAGTLSERRVWKCRPCKKQFSVLTGTIMHATKISVRIWVMVIFEMCSAKNGLSAREVERKYGVCPRSAWHMLHRIRKAMDSPIWGLVHRRRDR
jgi:transposase-like protein